MKRKLRFTIILYLYFIFIALLGLYFRIGYLLFSILYFGVPLIPLLIKLKKYSKKILVITTLITLPFVLMIDHTAHLSKSWYENGTINIRVFGTFPIDSFIWGLLYTLIIISVYSYLFDQSKQELISKNTKKLVKLTIILLIITGLIFIIFGKNLFIPYFYLIFLSLVSLWAVFLQKHPKLYHKMNLLGFWFFIPQIIYELVAMKLMHWEFLRGYHIGYIELFKVIFPFEELLWFYIVVVAVGTIYEVYIDDRK